ncbi:unnamed protein product [Allacma fusca]|uniref:Uncharacterized protein n=1 Tax=Allacma fusca TaxID=39272 RepID=A0A8J2PH72_9HEXA|nr:unnamed protein product [Allacma fusca]
MKYTLTIGTIIREFTQKSSYIESDRLSLYNSSLIKQGVDRPCHSGPILKLSVVTTAHNLITQHFWTKSMKTLPLDIVSQGIYPDYYTQF